MIASDWGKRDRDSFEIFGARRSVWLSFAGSRGKTACAEVVEKIGIVFDLSEEKTWDKEKRIRESLLERARNAGKRLSSDAVSLLFERLGSDIALLDGEVDKLICFVGDRPTLERSDVLRLSVASRSSHPWQMARRDDLGGEAESRCNLFLRSHPRSSLSAPNWAQDRDIDG